MKRLKSKLIRYGEGRDFIDHKNEKKKERVH